MKITLIGHASLLVETRGISILSDPWWRGPCFGAQWWIYPPPHLAALDRPPVDYVYVSHGHHDHFHPGTLGTLDRGTTMLVARDGGLAPAIRDLGFRVIEVGDDEELDLGHGVAVCIMPTHGGDTLMTIRDAERSCINLNDALHSADEQVKSRFVARLLELFPHPDYVFCGYGVASHFPNCYRIPGKDAIRTAALRQAHFNRQWSDLVHRLGPRFAFPFAADVVFLEDDLFWMNEVSHNIERPTAAFRTAHPASPVEVRDIAPGFTIEDDCILNEKLREPIAAERLRESCAAEIVRANRYGQVSAADLEEVAGLLAANLKLCAAHFADRDWRFVIRPCNCDAEIRIEKQDACSDVRVVGRGESGPAFDVAYTVRLPYLKRALTEPYGDEILFVGSGGIFDYRSSETASRNVHRDLMMLMRKHDQPPPPPQRSNRLLARLKQAARKLAGRPHADLYDLRRWTVWRDASDARTPTTAGKGDLRASRHPS